MVTKEGEREGGGGGGGGKRDREVKRGEIER